MYVTTFTYSFGIIDEIKMDSMSFFIDDIKQKFGIFENEIKEFVDLLEERKIINKVSFVEARTINPEINGYAFNCEVSIPILKDFIKREADYVPLHATANQKAILREVIEKYEEKEAIKNDVITAIQKGQKQSNKGNFPRIKAGTQWKHFVFQFINDDTIQVKVGNGNKIEEKITYQKLDCEDKRKTTKYPPYDSQWELLLNLAKVNGEIVSGGPFSSPTNEKAKQGLTQKLQTYFHIADDPFFPVDYFNNQKKKGSYKFRADIFPPSNKEKDNLLLERDSIETEVDEMFNNLQV